MIGKIAVFLALALLVPSCSNAGGVSISPYGQWATAGGHKLTITGDGGYEICRQSSCSSGVIDNVEHTNLSVILRGFMDKPQISNIAATMRGCVEIGGRLTGGMSDAGLSPGDLIFSPIGDTPGKGRGNSATVAFDCTDGPSVEFSKVRDGFHRGSSEEINRMEKLQEQNPLPSVQ